MVRRIATYTGVGRIFMGREDPRTRDRAAQATLRRQPALPRQSLNAAFHR